MYIVYNNEIAYSDYKVSYYSSYMQSLILIDNFSVQLSVADPVDTISEI